MTATANTVNWVSLFLQYGQVQVIRPPPGLRASEAFCQRGCLGGKPIALSPIDGVRSGVGVRTLDDGLVYNPPIPTPTLLLQSPFVFPPFAPFEKPILIALMSAEDTKAAERSLSRGREPVQSVSSFRPIYADVSLPHGIVCDVGECILSGILTDHIFPVRQRRIRQHASLIHFSWPGEPRDEPGTRPRC